MLTPSMFLERIDWIAQLIAFCVAVGLPTMALIVPSSNALITSTTRSLFACALVMTLARSWLIQPLKPLLVELVLKDPSLWTSSPK